MRCVENLVDPEAELGDETVVQVDAPEESLEAQPDDAFPLPSRRVTGKRAVRAVSIPSEALAEDLLKHGLFTPDHCGRLLELTFGGSDAASRRIHRGPMELAVVLGAYSHGGLRGITRASHMYPQVGRYLNEYLRRNLPPGQSGSQWSAITVVVAPEVAVQGMLGTSQGPSIMSLRSPPVPCGLKGRVKQVKSGCAWIRKVKRTKAIMCL